MVSIDCNARQVVNRLLMLVEADGDGVGESGGDANRRPRARDCWESCCDESQVKADGNNIVLGDVNF